MTLLAIECYTNSIPYWRHYLWRLPPISKTVSTIELDGEVFQLIEFQHVKPGKGGAFVRTRLRNMRRGTVIERTFRAGERIDIARVERRPLQYLYPSGDEYVFMDNESFDQITLNERATGSAGEVPPG